MARKRDDPKWRKSKENNMKKCKCGGQMKCKGPKNTTGTIYWKCKKCGRTLDSKKEIVIPATPLTYK